MRIIRRILCGLAALALSIGFAGCQRKNQNIPGGYTKAEEHFDPQGFQDFTDYCKYFYSDSSGFDAYSEIGEADVEEIRGYFADFRQWMETDKRLDEYDFDESCITAGDLVWIQTKGTGKYDNYTVCFFDVETGILYYVHQNI